VRSGAGRPAVDDEGVLFALGPHDVAMAAYLLGEWPVTVTARAPSDAMALARASDLVVATLRFPSGALLSLRLARFQPERERRLVVVGTRGLARFDDGGRVPRLEMGPLGEPPRPVPFAAQPEPLVEELGCFRDLLEGACADAERALATGLCDGPNGARVVRVLEACARSLEADGELTAVGRAPGAAA
jgi:predicted dehydrogenase